MTNIIVPVAVRVQGFFKFDAIRPDGTSRALTGWFPNLVTDAGLERIGTGPYLTACHVGTNNTAPNVLDTSLAGYLAGTTTIQASSFGAQSTAPYFGWKTITYRFAQGAAAGNISEVAIATSAAPAATIFSRALVLDGGGAPTTVTVLPDEVLDVTYQLRLYPPLTDNVQSGVTITGSGTHDITVRAANVTSSLWGAFLGEQAKFNPSAPNYFMARNGSIGAITSGPAGTSSGATAYNFGYGAGSLYRDGGATWGLNAGNLSGGIKSLEWTTSLGLFQCEFSPVINKISTKTLNLVMRVTWARNP